MSNKKERSTVQQPSPAPRGVLWHLSVLVLGILLVPLVKLVPHAISLLRQPRLDSFSVLSQGPNSASDCYKLQSTPSQSNVSNLSFCEDVELLTGPQLAGHMLLSCDDNRGRWNTVMGPINDATSRMGALYIWSAHAEASEPYLLELVDWPQDQTFHPLGTAYREEGNLLYIVNHRLSRSTIEVFELRFKPTNESRWSARHLYSLVHPIATHTPNSLVVLPGHQLVVTQDHWISKRSPGVDQLTETYKAVLPRYLRPLAPVIARALDIPILADVLSRLETLLAWRLSWVTLLEYDPQTGSVSQSHIIAAGIPFANGISISPGGTTLAVASTTAKQVRLYDIHMDSSKSSIFTLPDKYKTIDLEFMPDNLAFTPAHRTGEDSFDGASLIVSGHPAALSLLAMAKDPYTREIGKAGIERRKRDAPSLSVVIDVGAGYDDGYTTRRLFESSSSSSGELGKDGKEVGISTSSSAAWDPVSKQMVVVGLYGEGALVCEKVELQ